MVERRPIPTGRSVGWQSPTRVVPRGSRMEPSRVQRRPRPSRHSLPSSRSKGWRVSDGSRSPSRRGWRIRRQPAESISAGPSRQSGWRAHVRSLSSSSMARGRMRTRSTQRSNRVSTREHFGPAPRRRTGIPVDVTGHFDHKDAKTCKGISTDPAVGVPMGRDKIITECRATFVITGRGAVVRRRRE